MKKLLVFALLISGCFIYNAQAQIKVRVGINIGTQPEWGPSGYDHADYYYLPDMDVYYNVSQRQFIYLDNGRWVFGASLPGRYGNYDLYHSYKVVVNEPRPYLRADFYRKQYSSYRGRRDQEVWHGKKEWHDNGNHNGWKNKENRDRGRVHGNGNGNGNGRGKHRD